MEESTKLALNPELRKFVFALICLVDLNVMTIWCKFTGEVFVQLFSIVVISFLSAQAIVEWRQVK